MSMALKKNKSHFLWLAILFFVVLALYGYYDVTTSRQGGVSTGDRSLVHIMVMALMVIEFIYVASHPVNNYCTTYIIIPLFVTAVWMIFSSICNGIQISTLFSYLMFIAWWILTLKFFASYAFVNGNNAKQLVLMFIGMFFVWIYLNILARAQIQLMAQRYGVTMFVYYILILFPFVFYIKNILLRNVLIAICFVAVVISLKRGAIVTLPMMVIAYYTCKYKMEGKLSKIFLPTILGGVLIASLMIYFDSTTEGQLLSRFSESELASGSGRDELRDKALSDISNRDIFTFLIGRGAGATVDFLGTGAHNEWIESLFTYGFVGMLLYMWMFIRCAKYALKLMRKKSQNAPIVSMWVVYLFMCTMFSGFLYMHVAFYYWAGLGFVIGTSEYQKSLKIEAS